jgi:hypothetical protein
MILAEETHEVESTVERRDFTIKATGKAFGILSSNIYTRKTEAVIREISCNAHDAHVDAGVNRPFNVHLPTSYEPFFSVRDYGYGLSEDDMYSVYTCLFESTKTSSNSFIGALGLGSKSPFCISSSFIVISYNSGKKITYSCFLGEDKTPQIAKLAEEETTETGLEVRVDIPTDMHSDFRYSAIKVFEYFDEIPNINIPDVASSINQKKSNYDIDLWDSKGYRVRKHARHCDSYAVMGNVAYRIDSSLIRDNALTGIDVKFSIGDLSFNPGRESLSLDKKTKQIVEDKLTEVKAHLLEDAISIIEAEPTTWKKYIAFNNSRERMNFPSDIVDKYTPDPISTSAIEYKKKRNACSQNKISAIPVHGYKFYLSSPGTTRKIKYHVRQSGEKVIVLTQEQIDQLKIDPEFINDARNLPSPPTFRVSGDHYDCYEYVGSGNAEKIIIDSEDTDEKVYIIHNHRYSLSKRELFVMNSVGLYGITESFMNRKKFKSGNFISLSDYISREYPTLVGEVCELSETEITILSELEGEKADRVRRAVEFKNANKDRIILGNTKLTDVHPVMKEIIAEHPVLSILSRVVSDLKPNEVSSLLKVFYGKEKEKT